MNFPILKASIASVELNFNPIKDISNLFFTSLPYQSEKDVCTAIEKQLMELEHTQKVLSEELKELKLTINKLIFSLEEREEFLLRIGWIQRLYKTLEQIPSLLTAQEVTHLKKSLQYVPAYPLKKFTLSKLESEIINHPAKNAEATVTTLDIVMNRAIEQAGEEFINLGSKGREHVINNLVKKYGKNVPTDKIQEAVTTLEHTVASIAGIEDTHTLQDQLDLLPLSNYSCLSSKQKQMISEQLMENKQWKGLASLNRLIHQLDAKFSVGEEQEGMNTLENSSSVVVNVKYLDSSMIRYNI